MYKKFLGLATLAVVTSFITVQGIAQSSTQPASTSTAGTVIPGSADDYAKSVGNIMYFDFDSNEIKPKIQEQLDRAVAWLKQHVNKTIVIEGHADERGTREYNQALGQRRAQAVADYLVAAGIAPNRLSIISYGSDRPAVVGSDELHWLFNRRAVVVLN